MRQFGLGEDEYFTQLDAIERQRQDENAPRPTPRPIEQGSSIEVALNSVDRQVMDVFSMDEAEYRDGLRAIGSARRR